MTCLDFRVNRDLCILTSERRGFGVITIKGVPKNEQDVYVSIYKRILSLLFPFFPFYPLKRGLISGIHCFNSFRPLNGVMGYIYLPKGLKRDGKTITGSKRNGP